jgi:prepilin-type N-terminal cleavage/methylation domain-containing protein
VHRQPVHPLSGEARAGFSLLEVLVASVILLFIALALIPLFTRAMRDNVQGNDATQESNHGKSREELVLQLPFNNQGVTVPAGQVVGETVESWTQGAPDVINDANEGWWQGSTAGRGLPLWARTTDVRQFGVADLDDGRLDNPLPGDTQPIFVQLKEVEVRMESARNPANPLGGGRTLTFRMIKPF